MPPDGSDLIGQSVWLVLLALPVSSVAWTVTHEEVFRELRTYCVERSRTCSSLVARKFFYLFTCEYCFSHYVIAAFLWLTGFRLLLDDWRGFVIALFALAWLSNVSMSLYGRLRVDIKAERTEIEAKELDVSVRQQALDRRRAPAGHGASRQGAAMPEVSRR